MEPRYYQTEAADAAFKKWEYLQRLLLVLPTGTGKTIIFCKIIEEMVRQGKRCLILAHRDELLDQAADKLRMATGLACAVEKAEDTCLGEWERVVVGLVQSLSRQKRLKRFPADYFDVIIVDEAHHVLAESYLNVLKHFEHAKVLGVTATPDRGDLRDLGQYFDDVAYEYTLPKAIKDRFLSPIRALSIPLEIDVSGVKMDSGDYLAAALGSALDPYLEAIAKHMAEHCKNKKALIFLPLIATSQKMCRILCDYGFDCREVNGESPDRAEILADFAANKFRTLCNSMLLTEGYDCPDIDCIVPLRLTKIRSLFCQMVGRGTRIFPGKEYLLLLDFLWNTAKHDLCRPAHLLSENEDIAKQMTQNIQAAGCPVDLEAAEEQAVSDCVQKREEALAKRLEELRRRKQKLVDPLQYAMSIQSLDLSNYVPAFGWESEPIQQKQKEQIEKAGLFPDAVPTRGQATLLLNALDSRRSAGLATPKQIRLLEQKGFQHVGAWEFDDARRLIDRIAGNGWRVPAGISAKTYSPKTA